MTTSTWTSNNGGNDHPRGEAGASITRIKQKARARKLRSIRRLASQVQIGPDGTRSFIRFSRAQRIEHAILIASFGTLVVTGLLQTFSDLAAVGFVIRLAGSIDTLRMIHHLAAVVLIAQSAYHVVKMLEVWIVQRERGAMWPQFQDLFDLIQMIKFNLGLTEERPEFDRFTIEEKLEYWAMLWGTPLMIVTGLILWFPSVFTRILPGELVPIALALHGWEAKLATLAILTWHTYNVIIKETNRSVFTGTMTEQEMQHSHPLEYRRILAAHEFLLKLSLDEQEREARQLKEPRAEAVPPIVPQGEVSWERAG